MKIYFKRFIGSLALGTVLSACGSLPPIVEDTSAVRPRPDVIFIISAARNGPLEKIEADLNNNSQFAALCPPLDPRIKFTAKNHWFGTKKGYRTIGYGCMGINNNASQNAIFALVTEKTMEYASRYPRHTIETNLYALSTHEPGVSDGDGDGHGGSCVPRICSNFPISGHPVPYSQCLKCPPS